MALSFVFVALLCLNGATAELRGDRPHQLRPAAALLAARSKQRHSSFNKALESLGDSPAAVTPEQKRAQQAVTGTEVTAPPTEAGKNSTKKNKGANAAGQAQADDKQEVQKARSVGKPEGVNITTEPPKKADVSPTEPPKKAGNGTVSEDPSKDNGHAYASLCMYIFITLGVNCLCCEPGALYLAMQSDKTQTYAGCGLSALALLAPFGALIYVIFGSSIFSQYWKGGLVAEHNMWCGALCIGAIVLCVCACGQLCYVGFLTYQKSREPEGKDALSPPTSSSFY